MPTSDDTSTSATPASRWRRLVERVSDATQNALEVIRVGRLTDPYRAPFVIRHTGDHYRLRHYSSAKPSSASPILLVPPLMVASEIYDIAPDISAVGALCREGMSVWLVDFGAPEDEEGGMSRTLDDHVLAVDDAVERVREMTGREVHLAGYSQGGMFVYQAAAYRRGEGLASLITFGSPVDLHRNIPAVHDAIAQRVIAALRALIDLPLEKIDGLPGRLTSLGFKLVSVRKELGQLVDFVRKLHDRQALERRESRRIFLGGEGFIAWPGPALKEFIDEMLVHNRMVSGGFVIGGRTVTLADIDAPILCFIGARDDMVRPPSVRAIRHAAPDADVHEVMVPAGHFGLVVGSTSLRVTWPTVTDWIHWHDDVGERPEALDVTPRDRPAQEADGSDLVQVLKNIGEGGRMLWRRMGERIAEAAESWDVLRTQVPKLRRLRAIHEGTRVSPGLVLAEQAEVIPDRPFFIWRDRAFSYAQANRRVDNVVRGLVHCGVRSNQRVGMLMSGRPSFLSMLTAINRLGAVAVLISLETRDLPRALAAGGVEVLVTDPERAADARAATDITVLMIGGGRRRVAPEGVVDMEAIDPDAVEMPVWYRANPGRARDVAMVILGADHGEHLRVSEITHHRWAFSAIGAATTCALDARDTVYACLPLHHPSGVLVAAGSALVGGCRLALAEKFEPERFWPEVRRYGVTVVFYAGEMCRPLLSQPPQPAESHSSLRLLAGSGMPIDVWRALLERIEDIKVLEFYASTEGGVVLVNAAGEKPGSIGRPLPGSATVAVVAIDPTRRALVTDDEGHLVRCAPGEVGVLIARLARGERPPRARVFEGAFDARDRWLISGDLVSVDRDGDFWFFDRLSEALSTPEGLFPTSRVEAALCAAEGVHQAAVYTLDSEPVAAVVLDPEAPDVIAAPFSSRGVPPAARPTRLRLLDALPMSEGFRVVKRVLRTSDPEEARWLRLDGERYVLDEA